MIENKEGIMIENNEVKVNTDEETSEVVRPLFKCKDVELPYLTEFSDDYEGTTSFKPESTIVGNIYITKDYGKFVPINGNRDCTDMTKGKIKKSIEKNGILFSPIIVNEKGEIIDGQNRMAVLMDMGEYIPYIIVPSEELTACQQRNSAQTNWSTRDHMQSLAKRGSASAQRMLDTVDELQEKVNADKELLHGFTKPNQRMVDRMLGRGGQNTSFNSRTNSSAGNVDLWFTKEGEEDFYSESDAKKAKETFDEILKLAKIEKQTNPNLRGKQLFDVNLALINGTGYSSKFVQNRLMKVLQKVNLNGVSDDVTTLRKIQEEYNKRLRNGPCMHVRFKSEGAKIGKNRRYAVNFNYYDMGE